MFPSRKTEGSSSPSDERIKGPRAARPSGTEIIVMPPVPVWLRRNLMHGAGLPRSDRMMKALRVVHPTGDFEAQAARARLTVQEKVTCFPPIRNQGARGPPL